MFAPPYFQFLHLEGMLFYHLNQDDQAIASLRKSMESGKPSSWELHSRSSFTLAKIYEKQGNYKEALRYNQNGQKLKAEIDKKDDDASSLTSGVAVIAALLAVADGL